ncbi:MAG: MBL fold metallo-hydrolase [Pseudoalteromonas sp.]|nr:MBL fold metallo-hydrolase [Pseudoalteromonas sp.]
MKVVTKPVTAFMQNTRFITCSETGETAILDPGGDAELLLKHVTDNNLNIRCILLTHGHLDHVGACVQLAKQLDIKIFGPCEEEKFWFDALPMQSQMFGFDPHEVFYPDNWLKDGDVFELGCLKFEVRHCPGHTPGHIVFYEAANKAVFVGDVLFKGSVGRTDFPKGDSQQLTHSIKTQLFTLPDDVEVYSGHGPNTSIGYEKAHNPFMSGRFG